MRWTTAGVAGLWLALSGCGASVSLGPADGGADAADAPIVVDRPVPMDVSVTPEGGPPPGCVLPGGGLCPFGASCPAGDGCNDCSCEAVGMLRCTARPCAFDAGPGPSFDCDPLHVECGGIPDACPSGQVHSVSARCWGSCVDFAGCATLACDPAVSRLQCPPGALCSAATRTCQLATR